MAAMQAAAIVASDMSDMREVGTFGGDAGLPVSAFNSSI
jgi:hypothetical protein